jgi:hypothetical protein
MKKAFLLHKGLTLVVILVLIVATYVIQERKSQKRVFGEICAANLIMVKTLYLLREGMTNKAFNTLETALDINLYHCWQLTKSISMLSNEMIFVKKYREIHPEYRDSLMMNTNSVAFQRYERVRPFLNAGVTNY